MKVIYNNYLVGWHSPCCTLYNVIQNQKCKPRLLIKLSLPFPAGVVHCIVSILHTILYAFIQEWMSGYIELYTVQMSETNYYSIQYSLRTLPAAAFFAFRLSIAGLQHYMSSGSNRNLSWQVTGEQRNDSEVYRQDKDRPTSSTQSRWSCCAAVKTTGTHADNLFKVNYNQYNVCGTDRAGTLLGFLSHLHILYLNLIFVHIFKLIHFQKQAHIIVMPIGIYESFTEKVNYI